MTYLLIFQLLLLLCGCSNGNTTPLEQTTTIQNEYGATETIQLKVVETYSLAYRFIVIALIIACIFFYRHYKLGNRIEDYFNRHFYTWLSLGFLVSSILVATTYDTDAYYRYTFLGFGVFLTPYFLYGQYHDTDDAQRQLTIKQDLTLLLLGIIDACCIYFIRADLQVVILLTQTLVAILYEGRRPLPHR